MQSILFEEKFYKQATGIYNGAIEKAESQKAQHVAGSYIKQGLADAKAKLREVLLNGYWQAAEKYDQYNKEALEAAQIKADREEQQKNPAGELIRRQNVTAKIEGANEDELMQLLKDEATSDAPISEYDANMYEKAAKSSNSGNGLEAKVLADNIKERTPLGIVRNSDRYKELATAAQFARNITSGVQQNIYFKEIEKEHFWPADIDADFGDVLSEYAE